MVDLTVQVSRNASDYAALQKYVRGNVWRHDGLPRTLYIACAIVAGGAAVVTAFLIEPFRAEPSWMKMIILVLLYFGFRTLVWSAVTVLCSSWIYDPGTAYEAPVRISITSGGLRSEGQEGENILRWPSIKSLVETKSHFMLSLDRVRVVAIPKRAFAGEAETKAFGEALRSHIRAKAA